MAFQPETATWEAGVFQLEITTPVQGGVGGASNSPLLHLSNRTAYLKSHVDALESAITGYAPLNSPNLTGSPTAPSPAQYDEDSSIATTAFVHRALGNVRGSVSYSVNTTLTNSDIGKAVSYGLAGGGLTFTLPLANSVGAGSCIMFRASSDNTLAAQGTDTIAIPNTGGTVTSFAVKSGDTFTVMSNGSTWLLIAGTPIFSYFPVTFGVNGYMTLPNGLILQWGVATTVAGSVSVTLPIAFPNNFYVVVASDNASGIAATHIIGLSKVGLTGFDGYSKDDAGAAAATAFMWFALGR